MKQTFTLAIFLLLSSSAFSQTSGFTLSFEDTSVIHQVYYTDSILDPAGIWQIGKPNKPVFDSAYESTNATLTRLDSTLPPNTTASFTIKTSPTQYLYTSISFDQKFDFANAHGGAYVQYSTDSGSTWYNTAPVNGSGEETPSPPWINWAPEWHEYYPLDTLPGPIPYFTGTSNGWVHSTIFFPCYAVLKTTQFARLWYKFTVFTDSTQTSYHAGWMIDNINFQSGSGICSGINEINSSYLTINPNPVENAYTISLTDEANNEYTVSLLDLTGREMAYRNFTGREVTLRRDGLAAGSYIVKVSNTRTQDSFEKRVVFE
ncbi:MAG: hypothetical protein JWO03_2061 [Bacteroidetes bacterium]|nr:hypothetical protein [Bacteroidota bacterium]